MNTSGASPIYQAAAVPYRFRDGRPEFCLITSVRRGRWGIPKGIIDPGETGRQTALKEAEEEAGLCGGIQGDRLGNFRYFKWGTVLYVTVYLMRVTQVLDDWQEAGLRQRRWCGPDEARAMIHREEIRRLIDGALERIQSDSEARD